jgi:mannose-1-phosphate guanylyltransferase
MKAMLLAAGLGTRMAPLTNRRAKPALPVLDRSLIAHHLATFAALGIEQVVVNAHAHREQVQAELAAAPLPAKLSLELELLGSGGGIRRAAALLAGPDPFLVVNADMCVEFELAPLLEAQRRARAPIALLLREDPRKRAMGSIGYGIAGRVCRITDRIQRHAEETGSGLYTGIQLMSGDIFERFPQEEAFEVVPRVWVPLLEAGEPLAAVVQDPAQRWEPVGTPGELLEVNLAALRRLATPVCVDPSARAHGELRAPVWLGAGAQVAAGARVGPHAVIGAGARVGPGCLVEESLLLPGTELAAGSELRRAVAFDREVWRGA